MSAGLWIAAGFALIAGLVIVARRLWRAMVEVMRHGREG